MSGAEANNAQERMIDVACDRCTGNADLSFRDRPKNDVWLMEMQPRKCPDYHIMQDGFRFDGMRELRRPFSFSL